MIEIFRHNNKWRINIKNETLEFESLKELELTLSYLLKLKEKKEPNKQNE